MSDVFELIWRQQIMLYVDFTTKIFGTWSIIPLHVFNILHVCIHAYFRLGQVSSFAGLETPAGARNSWKYVKHTWYGKIDQFQFCSSHVLFFNIILLLNLILYCLWWTDFSLFFLNFYIIPLRIWIS